MDIIVTTPKDQMASAAREAADCIAAGGGEYFRRFPVSCYPTALRAGARVYYVEDGFVRGFAVVSRVQAAYEAQRCDTTGRRWPSGIYVFMAADSWKWIRPIPMKGFQGFRHYETQTGTEPGQLVLYPVARMPDFMRLGRGASIIGGWRDPRPERTKP